MEALRLFATGGLLFIYDEPAALAIWANICWSLPELMAQSIFKYWIAIDLNEQPRRGISQSQPPRFCCCAPSAIRPAKTPPPFKLNVKCAWPIAIAPPAAGTLADWGGKKHLMNPFDCARRRVGGPAAARIVRRDSRRRAANASPNWPVSEGAGLHLIAHAAGPAVSSVKTAVTSRPAAKVAENPFPNYQNPSWIAPMPAIAFLCIAWRCCAFRRLVRSRVR